MLMCINNIISWLIKYEILLQQTIDSRHKYCDGTASFTAISGSISSFISFPSIDLTLMPKIANQAVQIFLKSVRT